MGAKAERTKRKRVRLVGGGYRYSRSTDGATGSSAKALRRAMRKNIKNRKDLTPAKRRAMKEQIRELYASKNKRSAS